MSSCYQETIGDGRNQVFVIDHGLSTTAVFAVLYRLPSLEQMVLGLDYNVKIISLDEIAVRLEYVASTDSAHVMVFST